jgi:hypothetical protein
VNSRNVITHLDSDVYQRCPVCQHAIAMDHDEALAVESARYVEAIIQADSPVELIEVTEGVDFVMMDTHHPDETLPPTRQ